MGRSRRICLDDVLKAAEAVLIRDGGAAFSIAAVAHEAGITKGGVQSCAGSKEALIRALVSRWLAQEEKEFDSSLNPKSTVNDRVKLHITGTKELNSRLQSKIASAYATMLSTPASLDLTREWYKRRIAGFEEVSDSTKYAKIAFLAAEGMFFTRFLGLIEFTDKEWVSCLNEILYLID